MFEKIKKAVSVKSVPSEIAQFFKELRKENSALADILATYVAYGKDPMELMNLSPGMQGDFNFFAGNTWGYWFAALQPLANKPGKLTLEQWLRLGQVFMLKPVFADNKKQKVSTAPPWFVELQGRRQLTCEDSALYRSVWNLSSLHPLLVAAGIENNHVPRVIVEAFLLNLNGRHYDWDKPIRVFTKIEEVHARPLVALINRESSIIPEIMALADAPTKVGVSTWLTLFPELLPPLSPMISDWACDSAKTVRKAAIGLIGLMRNEQRDFALKTALEKGSASRLDNVISYAGLLGSEGRTLLEEVLARGEGGKRDEMISVALRQSEAVAEMPQAELSVLPAPPLNTTPLDETYVTQLEEVAAKWTASLAKNEDKWAKNSLRAVSQLSRTDYRAVVDWLNGTRSKPAAVKALHHLLLSNTKLPLLPALRVAVELTSHRNKSGVQELNFYYLDNILGRDYDLRSLLQAAQLLGVGDAVNQIAQSAFRWQGLAGRNPEHIWPFFVEHPVRLDEALGLRQKTKQQNYYWGPDELGVAIAILEMYPVLPTQYIPLLAQMATSERKSNRKQAQELLEARQSVLPIATQALSDSKSEIRATAAAWIGRIANTDGIEPLQKALAKEKQEKAQAAMLNALHRLGDDISAYLTPEVLQAAATKGLSAKIPAAMDWVPLEALPGCRFADGSQVDPSILRWWAILAVKLKDPQGAGLIPLYVSLLDKDSRETLGRFILDLWIAYDTTGP
ncbi:MAG: hypothetical protein FWE41_01955, partial [Coriobacteriia bacterium]|nr:hypothetical protein [Coriobacteriia bacterium]